MSQVKPTMTDLKNIPSVDHLLQDSVLISQIDQFGRKLTVDFLRLELDEIREEVKHGAAVPSDQEIIYRMTNSLVAFSSPSLKPVINATGVVLHTNLGRSPISEKALSASGKVTASYSNLEFNLITGKRGSRNSIVERLLIKISGAEAGLVVNNNAAALLLILTALAKRKKVIISRTQLIEIGDGFRIPEVMQQSGAKLVEIGSTNRVNLEDYKNALGEPAALIMRAHHSNFKIIGFTHEPALSDLVNLAHEREILFLDDVGSGALVDTRKYGLAYEPTVQDSVAAGADIVCFSGDKLLGGPQAGIIVGKADTINKIRKHPLARAVRADKLALSLLEETLVHYLIGDYEKAIPIWQMISKREKAIKKTAEGWRNSLNYGAVEAGYSTVGGGSLPEELLPTHLLKLRVKNPDRMLGLLRKLPVPVIARIEADQLCFDPRTVFESQESTLLKSIKSVLDKRSIL